MKLDYKDILELVKFVMIRCGRSYGNTSVLNDMADRYIRMWIRSAKENKER